MKGMPRIRLLFLSLLTALVLLSTFIHTVSASDLKTIKKPIPTVTAEVIHCTLEEGWCSKDPYVLITGEDPAYSILSINGSTNGKIFQFEGKTCSIPLNIGTNQLIFWSVSSSGVTSEQKVLTINLTTSQTPSLINSDLIQKAEASLLTGRQLLNEGGYDLKDILFINPTETSLLAEPPAIQVEALDAEDSLKIRTYIFNHILRRNLKIQKITSNLQDIGVEYNLVLDLLPPSLTMPPQQSISGTLTFEGTIADDVSGINSLKVNVGQGWQPIALENNHWTYQWNTEKAGISSGVFDFQVQVDDHAGNQQIQAQRVTVLNRIWPVLSLCALFLSLGFTSVVDPRRKAWRGLAHITARAVWLDAIHSPKEKR